MTGTSACSTLLSFLLSGSVSSGYSSAVADTSDLLKTKLLPAAAGLIVLLVAGVAGGKIAGFKIEPESCDECGLALASCETRVEVMTEQLDNSRGREEKTAEALEAAKTALIQAYQECSSP